MGNRSIVYVDGFNLYYGAVRNSAEKWLDLARYFRLLRPGDDLRKVKYFTALINGDHRANQETYLRALATTSQVEVILGKYKRKHVVCGVQSCENCGNRHFRVAEEKRTDVNIAVHMLDDAYRDECDRFILVSGDSDLVPAVATVRQRFQEKRVVVYVPARNPARGAAVELRASANAHRNLPVNLLAKAQFPSSLRDAVGQFQKPDGW